MLTRNSRRVYFFAKPSRGDVNHGRTHGRGRAYLAVHSFAIANAPFSSVFQ